MTPILFGFCKPCSMQKNYVYEHQIAIVKNRNYQVAIMYTEHKDVVQL